MIEQFEKHKEQDEDLWLFFTALRKRLKEIAIELKKNPEVLGKYAKLHGFVDHFTN